MHRCLFREQTMICMQLWDRPRVCLSKSGGIVPAATDIKPRWAVSYQTGLSVPAENHSPVPFLFIQSALLGISRKVQIHRNTSPVSSRLLVFADSFWNFSVRCLLSFPNNPFCQNLISLLSSMKRLFVVVVDRTFLTAASAAPLPSHTWWDDEWFVPLLLYSWSHPFKGYFCLHRAVVEGWCIGG